MTVVVIGAGAIGGTTGAGLIRGGHDVVLVDPWFENVERIRREGLALTLDGERHQVEATVLYPDELSRLDAPLELALLACKSYDTELMVRWLEPYLAANGLVVSLQNGINEDRIAELLGPERTMGCVVHYNAALLEPAQALKFSPSAWRSYTVGELDGRESARAAAIASLLGAAGPSATTTDIFGVLWAKLAVNCMVNGLTASTGLSTPELWASPLGLDLMIRLAAEAAEVARAQGREMQPIHLIGTDRDVSAALLLSDEPAAGAEIRRLMQAEAAARLAVRTTGPAMATSMLQDMRKGRRPEIDYLNGYVVREGEAHGVSAPVNDAVVDLVLAVSRGELRQDPGHLERVAQSVA